MAGKKKSKDAVWIGKMFAVSVAAAAIVGLLCITLTAVFMDKLGLSKEQVGICIYGVYVLSALAAGVIAGKWQKEKKFVWGGVAGIVWLLVVCLVSIGLHGIHMESKTIFSAAVCMLGGGMIGGMLA